MDTLPYGTPPQWWAPRPNRLWMRIIRPVLRMRTRRLERLLHVDVVGLEYLRRAVADGCGVVIASKHVGHADAFVLLEGAERLGQPFAYMVGWQVFQLLGPLDRWVLQRHGCFSVNREGHDFRAIRQAVEIVREGKYPLVVFPEGEIYHHCDWVAPFRKGTAAIALTAAGRGDRRVVCVPAALRYHYVGDPAPHWRSLVDRLECKLLDRPQPTLPIAARVYHCADALLSQRERHYLGHARSGPFPARIEALSGAILRRLEDSWRERPEDRDVPDRVTRLRRHVIKEMEALPAADPRHARCRADMDDLSVVIQLYSYSRDYVEWPPSPERLGEILDKFEEDVLGAPTASVRTAKRATVLFGEPVEVNASRAKEAARDLTQTLERRLQALVDTLGGRPARGSPAVGLASPGA